MEDESLQFVPCFFRPYSGKIFPMSYFNGVLNQDDPRRNNGSSTLPENPFPRERLPTNQRPEFEAILKEAQKENPDGDYLGAANCRYHSDLWMWAGRECEMDVRARELWDYLQGFIETSPEVQSDSLTDNTLIHCATLRSLEVGSKSIRRDIHAHSEKSYSCFLVRDARKKILISANFEE